MIFVVHVWPPSNDMPSNSPENPSLMFVTTTRLRGFVGLTAMASSASLPDRMPTSTFGGTAPPPDGEATSASATKTSTLPTSGRFTIVPLPGSGRAGGYRPPGVRAKRTGESGWLADLEAARQRIVVVRGLVHRRPAQLLSRRLAVPGLTTPREHGQIGRLGEGLADRDPVTPCLLGGVEAEVGEPDELDERLGERGVGD